MQLDWMPRPQNDMKL